MWLGTPCQESTTTRTVISYYYFSGLPGCPWCRFEATTCTTLFNAPIYGVRGGSLFDLAGVWARIAGVEPPGSAPSEPSKDSFGAFKPSLEVASLRRSSTAKAFGILVVIALGLTLLFAFPGGWALWSFLGISMISGIAESNPNRQKILEFEAKHRTAEVKCRTNKQRWDRDAGDVGFKAKLSERFSTTTTVYENYLPFSRLLAWIGTNAEF